MADYHHREPKTKKFDAKSSRLSRHYVHIRGLGSRDLAICMVVPADDHDLCVNLKMYSPVVMGNWINIRTNIARNIIIVPFKLCYLFWLFISFFSPFSALFCFFAVLLPLRPRYIWDRVATKNFVRFFLQIGLRRFSLSRYLAPEPAPWGLVPHTILGDYVEISLKLGLKIE